MVAFLRAQHQPAIAIETNGLGRFLPDPAAPRARRPSGCAVDGASSRSARRPRITRILNAFDPLLAAGALRAHASVWETPFVREMREWLPGGRGRDDGLDAVSGCILAQPVRLGPRPPSPARRDWRHPRANAAGDDQVLEP